MTIQQFNDLSREQKVMTVAHDIKEQIRLGRLEVEQGTYVEIEGNFNSFDDVKSNIEEIKECKVCALGAAMLSVTKFANTLNFEQLKKFNTNDTALELLSTVFSPKQMLLIETAFEGYHEDIQDDYFNEFYYDTSACRIGHDWYNETLTYQEVINCNTYQDMHSYDDARLVAICDNILKNNGTFIP